MQNRTARALLVTLSTAAIVLATAPPAQAYIDPNTGSYFLQIFIGAFAAIATGFTIFGRRIMEFFGRTKKRRAP